MNDLLRPSSLFGGRAPAASAPAGVLATIPNPPPEASRLATGTILRGTVVGEDGKGHVLVRTDLGVLTVATKMHPQARSEVTLQIRANGAQLHVLLMHSDGPAPSHPDPHGSAPVSHAAAPSTSAARGEPVGAPDVLTLGQGVRAILQSSATSAAAPGARPASGPIPHLAPGSELHLRILSVQAPPTTGGPGRPPLIPPKGPHGTATAGAVLPSAPSAASAPAATGAPSPTGRPEAGSAVGTTAGSPAPQGPIASLSAPSSTHGGPNVPGPGPFTAPIGSGAAAPVTSDQPAGTTATPQSYAAGTTAPAAGGRQPTASAISIAHESMGAPRSAISPSGGGPRPGPSTPPRSVPVPPAGPSATASSIASRTDATTAGTPRAPGNLAANTGAPAASGPNKLPPGPPVAIAGSMRFGGEVNALTGDGRPVVQTPLGTLTLEVRAPMPAGTRLQLELPASGLPTVTPPGRGVMGGLGGVGGLWSAVEEAVTVIQQAAPASGADGTPALAVPQPGPRLASGLLFFLSALSAGDVGRWLGIHAVETLRSAGREELFTSLRRDFAQLGRMTEGAGGEWRMFLIPLLDGQQVQPLRFYLRQGRRGGTGPAEDEPPEATRFVLEVELSRLGDMQLDGLVRTDRFDLMLRTRQPLPEPMRRDITRIFEDANGAAGYAGRIGFQASSDWRAMPLPDAGPSAPSDLVV